MATEDKPSVVYILYVESVIDQRYLVIGAYLLLAGVIALLLCLVLLSIISTYLLHRDAANLQNKPTPTNCELLECRIGDGSSPYHYTQLHQLKGDTKKQVRSSLLSDNYAKPFNPGRGISLSRHCVSSDEEGPKSPSRTSLNQSETVSYHDPFDLIPGYTYNSDHVITESGGDNCESDGYQPVHFVDSVNDRLDKYGSSQEGDYIVPEICLTK